MYLRVGDQMSHYNVNASVAKTLIQHLIRFVAVSGEMNGETASLLHAVLDTEISPELVPSAADEMNLIERAGNRALRIAGFQSLLPYPIRLQAEKDRLPRVPCVEQYRARSMANGRPGYAQASLRSV